MIRRAFVAVLASIFLWKKDSTRTDTVAERKYGRMYFISPDGDDANNGTSPELAFRTYAECEKHIAGSYRDYVVMCPQCAPITPTMSIENKTFSVLDFSGQSANSKCLGFNIIVQGRKDRRRLL
jgi:hypothetical protein